MPLDLLRRVLHVVADARHAVDGLRNGGLATVCVAKGLARGLAGGGRALVARACTKSASRATDSVVCEIGPDCTSRGLRDLGIEVKQPRVAFVTWKVVACTRPTTLASLRSCNYDFGEHTQRVRGHLRLDTQVAVTNGIDLLQDKLFDLRLQRGALRIRGWRGGAAGDVRERR